MEYVPGRSVQDYMKATGPLNIEGALLVIYKCCVGLAYIHYHGVIHRDIKPGNIMYHPARGIAKLMDFSVAHNIEDRDGFHPVADLSGKYPFTSENTAYQILHEDPVPITELRPDVPQEAAVIINKAIVKADGDRFAFVAEFADAIENLANRLYPDSDILNTTRNYMSPQRLADLRLLLVLD